MSSDLKQKVLEFISFYATMGRATSLMEIKTRAPISNKITITDILDVLSVLNKKGDIAFKDGFYTTRERIALLESRTTQDFNLDKKWERLLRGAQWFHHIPFIDFAAVSGSISFGAIRSSSDFDIILGVKKGRIFTARYFASALFSLLRIRRLDDLEASSPNKFCFNHIVTPSTYEKEPHNYYRYELYRHMIPIFINGNSFNDFIEMNKWANISPLNIEHAKETLRHPSKIKKYIESILDGRIGNYIEQYIARPIATKRLSNYINQKQTRGRVVVSDEELEFHFSLNYEEQFSHFLIEK
ncbi:MAG: hypothetical protein LiPW41_763 [Parcubacteria group bacterium LiPW_41]|nr:MAG: hypothetical protein LiPW41_763 [Parcubacteria group bacterium LiPW_41]